MSIHVRVFGWWVCFEEAAEVFVCKRGMRKYTMYTAKEDKSRKRGRVEGDGEDGWTEDGREREGRTYRI